MRYLSLSALLLAASVRLAFAVPLLERPYCGSSVITFIGPRAQSILDIRAYCNDKRRPVVTRSLEEHSIPVPTPSDDAESLDLTDLGASPFQPTTSDLESGFSPYGDKGVAESGDGRSIPSFSAYGLTPHEPCNQNLAHLRKHASLNFRKFKHAVKAGLACVPEHPVIAAVFAFCGVMAFLLMVELATSGRRRMKWARRLRRCSSWAASPEDGRPRRRSSVEKNTLLEKYLQAMDRPKEGISEKKS